MSLKKIHDEQPEIFEFSKVNLESARGIIKKYPDNRKKSAVMPLLYLAQRQNDNWIPLAAMKYIGVTGLNIKINKSKILDKTKLDRWPSIRAGMITSLGALKVFDRILQGGADAPLVNVVGWP